MSSHPTISTSPRSGKRLARTRQDAPGGPAAKTGSTARDRRHSRADAEVQGVEGADMRFRIHKRKLLEALLAAALGFAVPASAQADEIARLCGAPVIPSPEFERGTLIDQTAGDIASGHEQVAFNRIADTYERSLRPGEKGTPAPDDFIRQLRAPTSRWSALWEISNDDNGDAILFERDITARKVTIPCRQRPLPAYFHDMAAIANYLDI